MQPGILCLNLETHSAPSYQVSTKSDNPRLRYRNLTNLSIQRRLATAPRDLLCIFTAVNVATSVRSMASYAADGCLQFSSFR